MPNRMHRSYLQSNVPHSWMYLKEKLFIKFWFRCANMQRGVQSQCDMRCHAGSHCVQQCNAQTCNLKCGGEECNQNCNGGEQGCLMQCIRNSWTQTCGAHTCEMTRSGSLNYYTGQICNSGNGPFCQRILMNGSLGPFKTTCQRRKQCTCPKCLNRDCMTFTWRNDIFRCP